MHKLADQLISILEAKIPNGIAGDEDLSSEICPSVGEIPLARIFDELKSDPLANYVEADGYDILSIERHGAFGITEIRILRNQSNSECSALIFNKHL